LEFAAAKVDLIIGGKREACVLFVLAYNGYVKGMAFDPYMVMTNTPRFAGFQFAVMVLLFLVIVTKILVELQTVMILLSLAMLFAFLLFPITNRLESWSLPRPLATLITIVTAIGVLVTLGYFISKPVSHFVADFPQLKRQALDNIEGVAEYSFLPDRVDSEWIKAKIKQLPGNPNAAYKALSVTSNTLTVIGLLPLFTFLMLLYRDNFLNFILQTIGRENEAETRTVVKKISKVSYQYMGGVFIVVSILCVVNSTGLWILGIRYALVLGIASAVINLIPYFGTLLGGAVVFLVTLLTSSNSSDLLAVALFFAGVQLLENWVLTPNITGPRVRINPLTTILSLMLGAMLWGIPGMFIAIPFMGILRIVCNHIEVLKPFAQLIGAEQKNKFPKLRQKLLHVFRGNEDDNRAGEY